MKKLFQKAGAILIICVMVLTCAAPAAAAEKTGLYDGQPAKFSYGSSLKTSEGQTYQFTGKDLNWMQMYCYNYQTGQSYTGGARELSGPLERYRIKTSKGSFVGYCIEHGVMVDEAMQLQASDYRNAVITAGLGEEVMQNIKLCLFYGRQNGDRIGNLLDSPEAGGLGFRESEFYGKNASSYTLDDWEMATVMLIRESQQKFRDSRFRMKSGGNGLSYTNGWRGPETGKINTDHYVNPLKGKAAYDIYKYMEQLCQDHFMFSSGIASMNPAAPKNIAFGAEDRNEAGNYYKKISVSASRAYPLKAVDKDNPATEAEGITVNLLEEGGKYCYEITIAEEAFCEGAVFALRKDLPYRVPTNDLLVWECATTNGHLQAITTGMADPLQGYFSLSTKAEPVQGTPPEPEYFPSFEFPVSKEDFNPGWDGSVNTPMGDATLAATYVLYRDGTEVDRVTLDAYGHTEILADQPWMSEEDLTRTESGETAGHMVETGGDPPEMSDHGCGTVAPTKVEWSGSCSYTIAEIRPSGRFTEPDLYDGTRSYTVSYYAETEDERQYACEEPLWKDIEYSVDYSTVTGSGSDGSAGPAPADSLDEILVFGEETFVNDCYRGKLTLSKSLEREDVFKDSPMGGHPESVSSRWKLYLAGSGYENSPYIRFVREKDLDDGTAVYRVTRDTSGADNATESMVIGTNGDIVIYDIPYGTYYMEELAPDDSSYIREKFLVEIGEHGGSYTPESTYDNRYDYNVRDKKITNRIKICKTDAETGKGVDLPGTKFYIRYKGSPLNSKEENEALENYNRYLPNASEITSDGPYTFEADENGELTVQYQLPYGIYEITEWQVPEGYYTGEEGNIYTFTVKEQSVHTDGNFGQKVTFDGRITAADSVYDPVQYPYEIYYQAVSMANNQVKGRITIEKTGEIFSRFLEEKIIGRKVFRPVYEMTGKLKDAVFGIFAAEDIMLSDGNDGPEIFDAKTGEKLIIPMEKSTHYGSFGGALQIGSLYHNSGAKLWYSKERNAAEDNHYTRVYVSPEQKDTTYSYTYETEDEAGRYIYDVCVTMNYQAGGRNVTDVKITKTSRNSGNLDTQIPLTYPSGMIDDMGHRVELTPLVSYICGSAAPDGERKSNALSVYSGTDSVENSETLQSQTVQSYEISFVQEGGNSDGFSMNWDGFELTSRADCELQEAVTVIRSQGTVPVIDCGIGYNYVSDQGSAETTFTAAQPKSPVYFLSADGIRTEMYYFGGYMKALIEIPQSAVDKVFDRLVPDMGFDWYSNLTPSEPMITYEPVRGTKVTAMRHENSETSRAESYTIEIVSKQTEENPFVVNFADGYTMTFYTAAAESGNGVGILVLDGVDKTTRYTLSELVETVRTDEEGKAVSSLLPIGSYIVRELEAPEGYILNGQETKVSLIYEDQFTPVVQVQTAADNKYVATEIELLKAFETGYQSGQFVPGGGAVFGLYAEDADGKKDLLLDVFSTDNSGRALRKVKLPLGCNYYIKELQTTGTHEPDNTPYYFRAEDVLVQPPAFNYDEDGINGSIVMESSGIAELTINTLARYPYPAITVNGSIYNLNQPADNESIVNNVFSDRTVTTVKVSEDKPVTVTLANGKNVSVSVHGNTFDYDVDGETGTFKPEAAFTGYRASYEHKWKVQDDNAEPDTETVVFKGPGSAPDVIEVQIVHTHPEEEGNIDYNHKAVINYTGGTTELAAGENYSFKNDEWVETEVYLGLKGNLGIVQKGVLAGAVSEAEVPEVTVNDVKAESVEFNKSVTFVRPGSSADTIQVKINTKDGLNSGQIMNLHKDVPPYDPVPELPELPDFPGVEDAPEEPEEPEPEKDEEPEAPEASEIPEAPVPKPPKVTEVPKTGESAAGLLWFITAVISFISIICLAFKRKEEN